MALAGSSSGVRSSSEPVDTFFQFSLLGLVASGYFAVAGSGYLDLLTTVAAGTAILVKTLLVVTGRSVPLDERWVTALTIAYIGFYPVDYLFLSKEFLPATVHLVLFLAVVKILTARTGRDHLYVVVVAFLEILAASLLSSRLNYFFFLALFLLFAVSTFASWEIRRGCRDQRVVAGKKAGTLSWRLAGLTVVISFGVLLFTAGLFFILPRTARAAFEHLAPERFHISAFSNDVTLGAIGEVKQQSTVLMHVRIPNANGLLQLKWRGNALAEFDGKRWFNSNDRGKPLRVQSRQLRLADDDQRRRTGRRLNYEVQLKSFASDSLFIAGQPEFIRIDSPLVIRTDEDSFRVGFRSTRVLRYGVLSYLDEAAPKAGSQAPELPAGARRRYLQLPDLDARIESLARRLTRGIPGEFERAREIQLYLQGQYSYSLTLPEVEAADPIAHFLFERRRGHCEYFASAMAVMLRSIGTPARVATGFQSGTFNPISGWHVIRASDAHSWVEAWLPSRGWTTFDPTPPDPSLARMSLWSRAGLLFDAADTFWQEWVLSYDLARQLTLATRMEKSRQRMSFGWLGGASGAWRELRANVLASLKTYAPGLVAGILSVILLGFAFPRFWFWWNGREQSRRLQRGEVRSSDATVMYGRALEILKRRGFDKPAWITPMEFAGQMSGANLAGVIARLTTAYNDLRFGGRTEAAPRMMALLGELERKLKA